MTTHLRVERLIPGGQGLARAPDGRAAFVPGGLPGDVISPLRLREKRRHVTVVEWELVQGGPSRLPEAPCALADRCGGCDWMYLDRPAQLRCKAGLLEDCLRRIGGFTVDVLPPQPVGPDLGYRARLRLHADRRGRLGLYERSSRQLVELTSCPVAHGAINGALATLRELCPGGLPGLRELELRAAPIGAPVVAVRGGENLPPQTRRALDLLAGELPVVTRGAAPGRGPDQAWPLPGGLELRVPADGFVQVNPAVNLALVEAVLEGARRRDVRTFVDLFCGAGNFSLPLLAAGCAGVGIELSEPACRAAERSARAAGLRGRFLSGDAATVLAGLRREGPPDLVVLDPPRTGARETVPGILDLAPATIACVSCDPATLARDLRDLVRGGYRLVDVFAFDMFPHTHHVEALAWLEREASPSPS